MEMSFEDFVNFLYSSPGGSDVYGNRHWISQNALLTTSEGNNLYDFVGKLENLEQDLKYISEVIGIDIKLPHMGSGFTKDRKPKHNNYLDYYTKELLNKVYHRYKDDFEVFGYNCN